MTDDSSLQPTVAAEYLGLRETLSQAGEADWDTPSLCEGWRVREVVAHLTMPARYDEAAFMAELQARDFDFTKLSNEVAARDGKLSPDTLLEDMRSEALLHWQPPGGGFHGALNHVVVHGLDVMVPLGDRRTPPNETVRIVLDDLTQGEIYEHFGADISGRRLVASDLDWSFGSGPELRARSTDLVLILCGRTVPSSRIEGNPL